jgi:murein DD-endopeptidase MepM/ murein hydrolase activator NlpD
MRVRTRIITTMGAGVAFSVLAAGPALASSHTVRPGDTLSGIAAQSGVSLAQVEAANPQITNPNVITVGELVNVPNGRSGSPASATPTAVTPSSTSTSTGATSREASSTGVTGSGSVAGSAPSSFQQCVAWRESSDTATDPDGLYGILPSTWASLGYSGTAGEASVAQQNQAFQQLYARDGAAPWAAYDGC